MKIMSKRDVGRIDEHLEMAKFHLLGCIKAMKGKYGTKRAVDRSSYCLGYIDDLMTNAKYRKDFYQKFRNPPNTPKSRRLGWHKGRVSNCDRESAGYCTYYGKPCHKKIRDGFRCGGYEFEGEANNEQ
jgi:hypothetical protein